jgi:hypothetical protein
MRRVITTLLICLTLVFSLSKSIAAPNFSSCLLVNPDPSSISLSLPLGPERLGNKSNIRIGVIPFYFNDAKQYRTPGVTVSEYRAAASNIETLSGKIVQIDMKIFPTIKTRILSKDFGASDFFGLGDAQKLIADADTTVDFSNLDAVILQNVSLDVNSRNVASALNLSRSSRPDVASSIQTKEGQIDNVILLSEGYHSGVIAHEILHSFGLVDLYPSESGIYDFSSMARSIRGEPLRILNYEKAVLGWFPTENIQCASYQDFAIRSIESNKLIFDDIRKDQLYILKLNESDAYVVEIQNSNLILYKLKNKEYPPITMVSRNVGGISSQVLSLSSLNSISNTFITDDFAIMYVDKLKNKVTLNLIPSIKFGTLEYVNLERVSLRNRDQLITEANRAKAQKVTTIKCIKGKTTKLVKGKDPKCPKGYVKQARP